MANNLTTPTTRQTTRSKWIDNRAAALLASGWQSRKLAVKRATTEWRNQTPQHQAAAKRNAALADARNDRLATLPASDPLATL